MSCIPWCYGSRHRRRCSRPGKREFDVARPGIDASLLSSDPLCAPGAAMQVAGIVPLWGIRTKDVV